MSNTNTVPKLETEYLSSIYSASVWKVASVLENPEISLTNWTIKKMVEGEYFVGEQRWGSGRVSTAIQTFDPETKKGVTASGRVYQLVGDEGYSRDGDYIWGYYKKLNQLTELPTTTN